MYVVTPTYNSNLKEPLPNHPLLEGEKFLKQNNFLSEGFLRNLRLNDLRKVAIEHGIGTKQKTKKWLIRELLKPQESEWYWASEPEYRLRKGEKYYTMFCIWNYYPPDWFVRVLATGVSEYVLKPESGEKTGTPYIQGLIRFQYLRYPSAIMKQLEGIYLEKPGSVKRCCTFCSKLSTRNEETKIKGFDKFFQISKGKISKVERLRMLHKVLDCARITQQEYDDDEHYTCTCRSYDDECRGCVEHHEFGNKFVAGFCTWKRWKQDFYPFTQEQREEQLRIDDEEDEKADTAHQRALKKWRKRNRFPTQSE